ncbi:site-specific integrase [Luteibacter sp. CQ10]|uniref:site-specific integrase n=1 Tax=Luteibacter sp. CQ10 TaxID=2805821 RepID=UPI0034A2D8F1
MHRQFKGRFKRPASAWPEERVSAQQHHANDVVRSFGAAEPPASRTRYYAIAENGMRVSTRSNRNRDDVLDELRQKAGGSPLVKCWHNGGEHGDSTLAGSRRQTPSERHRAVITHAVKPEVREAPTPQTAAHTVLGLLHAQVTQAAADPKASASVAVMAPLVTLLAQQMAQPGEAMAGSARIADRLDRWLRQMGQRETTRSSIDACLHSASLFVGVNGDLPLKDITRAHCERFIDALAVWPRNASKRRAYRNMSVPQIIEKAVSLRDRPIDQVTQQKHVERMRSFFSFCEIHDEVRPNLLYRVQLVSRMHKKQKRQHRRPFTLQELASIFSVSHPARFRTPFQFWMPIAAFYSGARVNELAQLYVDDVLQVDGRWFFSFSMSRPEQRIKNASSIRLVPIHPHLIDLGFLRFVQQAKAWGRAKLFPDVIWGRNGPGETVSRWFANMVRRELKITDAGQTFHAFRNTFIYYASRSKIPLPDYSVLTGHAIYDNVLQETYVLEHDAAERCAIYDRIQFPVITHSRYEPAVYEWVFRRAKALEEREERLTAIFGHPIV